jgi:hypothetical protein
LSKGLSVVADAFECFDVGNYLAFSLQFHHKVVLVGGEVVEDVVTAVANRGDAELEQFLLQLFLSDHIQVTLDYFLWVNFLEFIVEV